MRMSEQDSVMVRMFRSVGLVLALLCALTLGGSVAHGQVLYGSITGTVHDKTSAVVPNATVTLTNEGTGETRSTVTDGSGDYRVPDLSAGPYTVMVKAMSSFGTFTEKGVPIEINREARVDVTLQPASVSAEVTVNTAPPMLQTETAEVNHEITETQIAELPITSSQGRNYQALYTLIPGAANVIEQNSTASNPSRAMSLNVNGVEDMSNTTRIDGAVNYYGWLPYIVAYVPPADSIQSVNITTNSFNAEQGVAGGASINVTIKSGTRDFHGSVWEYYQDAKFNARAYTATQASLVSSTDPTGSVPKNVFDQFGFSIGGPIYIPKILTGKKKLFFFQDFERTTRRQLITGTQTVPTTQMLGGDFSAVASGLPQQAADAILYDPQPLGTGPYVPLGSRPTFMSEYNCNCIPATRLSSAAVKMLALLQPISAKVGTPTSTQLGAQLANDYNGSGTLAYNRNTSDSKVTYLPSDRTSIFGRYSVEPFTVADPQELGMAGGGTFDGGQPGAALGRIQNVGLGWSHVLTANLVIDADAGYTRQVSGAQSALDIADGDFGLNVLGIPGTNGVGPNYFGQPEFVFTGFSSIGNSNGANPFLFRDNQFTGDVNLSWTKGKHAMKYGATVYHFDLNHFQPTSGGGVSSPRGGFMFQGSLTTGPLNLSASGAPNNVNAYTALADMLLGLPNNGTGIAVAKETQLANPNSLRWSEYAGYAQDQWNATPKLTVNYGVRYEFYPAPYRDHTGVYRLDPTLPQTANVEVGGVSGNPENAGINVGKGLFAPRLGVAYRVTPRLVVRSGAGITEDPDSMRFLRDEFPVDLSPTYGGTAAGTPAYDSNGNVLTLSNGIPPPVFATITNGFTSLPVSGSTNTAPANYRRGYIESWNLFVQADLGHAFVANLGYVGTHQVRQLIGLGINDAPLPSGTTECMANGQYNPSSPFFTSLGNSPCSFNANQTINQAHCPNQTTGAVCYNTGGITMNEPLLSSNYNGMQAQLTRNAGRLAQFGVVYTWSHAFNFEDNGAGSGSGGLPITYPAYFALDRATASYDRTNNLQVWGIYHLPFGKGQMWSNHGVMSAVFGGFQVNGQFSHVSGGPFSVSPSVGGLNSPGNTEYAQLVGPYQQLGGHNRTVGNSAVSGGRAWFNPAAFGNPPEPTYITSSSNPANTNSLLPSQVTPITFGNTHRNEFRGPGVSYANLSLFRAFHVFRESEFQVRAEAFNVTNHPQLTSNPNATVGGGTFGYITSFGATRSMQFSGRFNF